MNPDDKDRIEIFKQRFAELRQLRLLNAGPVSLTVRRGLGSTADADDAFSGHDEEDFRSFLQCFRQFKANDDNANLGSVHNIIQQSCPDTNLKAWAAHGRTLPRARGVPKLRQERNAAE